MTLDFRKPRRHLDEMDRLDARCAELRERRRLVEERIAELRHERDGCEANRRPLYDPPEVRSADVDELLAGARSRPAPLEAVNVEEVTRLNVEVDNEVAQIDRDIAALNAELARCDQETGATKEKRDEAERDMLAALRDVLLAEHKKRVAALVHDCLLPMGSLAQELRYGRHAVPDNGLTLAMNAAQLGYWEDNRRVDCWPLRGGRTFDGHTTEPKEVLQALINRVRGTS